ncbi:unnamed protein product [Gulo gulo]|uniref:Uncharacterized protein n=1 Tax=Gulo gulo TaxID=48420 RepID=A0A9X9LV02_GULGU|nr:unnamed protein product [Gulo gulo]
MMEPFLDFQGNFRDQQLSKYGPGYLIQWAACFSWDIYKQR